MHKDRISEAHFSSQKEFAISHPSQWGLVSAYGFQEFKNIVKLNSQVRRKRGWFILYNNLIESRTVENLE